MIAAQETTYFNYTTHPHMTGLRPIGAHKHRQRGFLMHSALAVDAESGEPLGLLGAILWSRREPAPKVKAPEKPADKAVEKENRSSRTPQ